jgi:hypothetical protein
MRLTVVCSSDGAAPPLRYLLIERCLHLTASEPFTPRTLTPLRHRDHLRTTKGQSTSPAGRYFFPASPKLRSSGPADCLCPFK